MPGKLFSATVLGALSACALAQRPSDTSICDYYTTALLQDNTPANQYKVLTLVVNTALIGNYTQPNIGITVPGLLAPTTYMGEQVNLLPYFNGCLLSTNINNQPSSVNFLDGGGADALMQSLPANNPNTAQYFLVTHLYQFFGKLLGCSGYGTADFPSYQGKADMYDVHKFMTLDTAEIGWFIQNVGMSARSFGVTVDDVEIVGTLISQTFGYKCSPARDIGFGSARNSICIDSTCPTDPQAQCGAYDNGGVGVAPQTAPQCGGVEPTYTSSGYGSQPTYGGNWGSSAPASQPTNGGSWGNSAPGSQQNNGDSWGNSAPGSQQNNDGSWGASEPAAQPVAGGDWGNSGSADDNNNYGKGKTGACPAH